MVTTFTTEFASEYLAGVRDPKFLKTIVRIGRLWSLKAGRRAQSDDLAFGVYMVWRGLYRDDPDGDCLVVGEVSDQFTDKDCELLCEIEPALTPVEPIGGMSAEVTAVHEFLLDVAGAIRERMDEEDEEAER